MKYLIITIFILSGILLQAESIEIPEGIPFFREADPKSGISSVSQETGTYEILEEKRVCLPKNPMMPENKWHPLSANVKFFKVSGNSVKEQWYSPSFVFDKETDSAFFMQGWAPGYEKLFLIFGVLAIFSFFCILKADKKYMDIYGISAVIFLKLSILSYMICCGGMICIAPTDELSFVRIANDIWNCKQNAPWEHIIGYPIFLIPILVLSNSSTFSEIAEFMFFLNGYILMTVSAIFVFIILRKYIKVELWKSLCIIAVWLFGMLFTFPIEDHYRQQFGQFFGTAIVNVLDYRYYSLLIANGFNGMGDIFSMFLILLIVLLSLRMKISPWHFIIISMLFGFSCMVRLNNIFFAPVIAFLYLKSLSRAEYKWKDFVSYGLLSIISFAVAFSPQIIVNKLFYGGLLKFPYSVYHANRAADGFDIASLKTGIPLFFNCNYSYIVLFAAGLIFMKKGFAKTFIVLMIIPLLLFYCGYPVLGGGPVRFMIPMYPLFAAPFMMSWFFESQRALYVKLISPLILACIIFASHPSFAEVKGSDYAPYSIFSYILYAFFVILLLYTIYIESSNFVKYIRSRKVQK